MKHIDFETRGVMVKEIKGDYLAYAIIFKTARDRREFIERTLHVTQAQR